MVLVILMTTTGRYDDDDTQIVYNIHSMVTFSKSESQAGGARSPFMLLAKLVRYSEL